VPRNQLETPLEQFSQINNCGVFQRPRSLVVLQSRQVEIKSTNPTSQIVPRQRQVDCIQYHTSCDPHPLHRQPLQLHLQWNVNFASFGHPGCSTEHAFPLSCIRFAYPAQHCFSRAPTEALCLDISIYIP
jgi:hypothetical protein